MYKNWNEIINLISKDIENKDYKYSGVISNNIYIKKVIYNNPATIIVWSDGTKTLSKCHQNDSYNPEMGLLIAYLKKIKPECKIFNLLNEWAPVEGKNIVTLTDVRKKDRENKKL